MGMQSMGIYTTTYLSPVGTLTLACKESKLVGLWMEGQRHFGAGYLGSTLPCSKADSQSDGYLVLETAKEWLDAYFEGINTSKDSSIKEPAFAATGSAFSQEVWKILRKIPYGEVMTYGEIARNIASRRGISKMSSQAIGDAVGRNPISIIIPCHRVVGSKGSMVGYAGGVDKKLILLEHERANS